MCTYTSVTAPSNTPSLVGCGHGTSHTQSTRDKKSAISGTCYPDFFADRENSGVWNSFLYFNWLRID